MTVEVEVVLEAGALLGEGPTWDAANGRLLWVDILRHAVHSFDPATGTDAVADVGSAVGAVAPRASGGWVMAVEDGFALTVEDGIEVELVAPVGAGDPATRFNDGKCDPAGRFWAGTMAYEVRPGAGALYRLDPELRVTRMLDGVTISNGLAWSADHRTMFYVDTPTQGIDAFNFDLESGSLGERRRIVDIPPGVGMPDGMAIDVDGGLWVAMWGGSAVHRYRPDGRLDRTVDVLTPLVTSCVFGGNSLEELYITSARHGLSEAELAENPVAGALFRCRPGVSGTKTVPFAG